MIDSVLAKRHTLAHCPNLSYHVRPVSSEADKQRQLIDIVRGSTVVYAQTPLCRTHVLLQALGETVDWSQCGTATTAAVWRFVRKPSRLSACSWAANLYSPRFASSSFAGS